MSAPTLDLVWQQGEDLAIQMLYKEGATEAGATPVNLNGWSLRMDVKTVTSGLRLITFNSQSLPDVDPIVVGDQPDSITEAILGTDGTIRVTVSRSHTLPPSGTIYQQMAAAGNPQFVFDYDIFLRNASNLQTKILKGKITVERSITLWV